jgi:phage shock protein E
MKPSISKLKLLEYLDTHRVTVLDVRNQEEFNQGHLAGALNIPVDELTKRHSEVTNDNIIVTYCSKGGGRSEKAAELLIENGKHAVWLEGGFQNWSGDILDPQRKNK